MFRTHFYGQEISDYGRKYGRVDYHALAASFDAVLCNGILNYKDSWEDWEQTSGQVDNSEEIRELTEARDDMLDRVSDLTDELIDLNEDIENVGEAVSHCEDASDAIEEIGYYIRQLNSYEDDDESDADYCVDCLKGCLNDYLAEIEALAEEKQTEVDRLNKEIENLAEQIEKLELEEEQSSEVFQWYIISDSGARILEQEAPSEVVWYNEELDLYVWGVTHFGTAWSYVLTSIPCETYEQEAERLEAEAKAEQEAKARAEAMTEEERTEQEAKELGEALSLWDEEHKEDIDNAVVEAVEEELREEATEANTDEPTDKSGDLNPISWDDVILGDIVIGKAEASERYNITIEGWKGSITKLDRDEDGNVFTFDAVGFDNEPIEGDDYTDPNSEWWYLTPDHFDLYRKPEGGDR